MFALIALAARPDVGAAAPQATAAAYFPWAGALHVLLDSLVDVEADRRTGDHSLIGHYASTGETAARLTEIARRADAAVGALRDGALHRLMLIAMACFYLTRTPGSCAARAGVFGALGPVTLPARTLLVAHGAASAATRKSSSRLSTCRCRPGRE